MPLLIVPTLVRLEPVTPLPKLVASSTLVPAMRYSLALAMLTCSLNVHASLASTQLRVLSVVPLSVIPPPSAVASVAAGSVCPKMMFLSSMIRFVVSMEVVVPWMVRSPAIVALPPLSDKTWLPFRS